MIYLTLAQKLQKFESIRSGPDRVIFGYRYINGKLAEDYVALTNLRLEVVQISDRRVMYNLAAPVLEVRHGKSFIEFHDRDLVIPTEGSRSNILLRSKYLKQGESATPAPKCFYEEVTADSDEKLITRVLDICGKPAFPGIDMRMPQFYRCTKNPSRLRLNYLPELLDALGLESGCSAEELKEAFLGSLQAVARPTNDGWVVPFEWVYAGGMVVTTSLDLGSRIPRLVYVRSNQFFNNYVKAKNWVIECL